MLSLFSLYRDIVQIITVLLGTNGGGASCKHDHEIGSAYKVVMVVNSCLLDNNISCFCKKNVAVFICRLHV